VACVEHLVTGYGHVNYQAMPSVVYTHPEVASVGRTEDSLREEGVPIKTGTFYFKGNGRALAREVSTMDIGGKGDFEAQKEKVKKQGMDSHAPDNISLYKPEGSELWSDGPKGKDGKALAAKTHLADEVHQWGMAIDLSKCTGCSACVVACQEENNVPVVGKTGVLEGREMHWLRVDRYFEVPKEAEALQKSPISDPMFSRDPVVSFSEYIDDSPRVVWQPMMCQHCENAPCETVCPVSATMHSSDGLNQMIYNRCVGTRYCANNCPFKVRRFNWFNYSQDRSESFFARLYPELKEHARLNIADPLPKGMNPEVTVRSRGVMEKCTFCVQRIRRAKWQLRKENRADYRDGDVITACQQACPANAIAFGNLVDETSKVAKLHANARAHQPLKELGVESSVAYLTRIVNSDRDNAPHKAGHGKDNAEEAAH
jgi:molybdopterin-containing oxidoreductase family iron-sulfur binding subunit